MSSSDDNEDDDHLSRDASWDQFIAETERRYRALERRNDSAEKSKSAFSTSTSLPSKKSICYGMCPGAEAQRLVFVSCTQCRKVVRDVGITHHLRLRHNYRAPDLYGDSGDDFQGFLLSPTHNPNVPSTSLDGLVPPFRPAQLPNCKLAAAASPKTVLLQDPQPVFRAEQKKDLVLKLSRRVGEASPSIVVEEDVQVDDEAPKEASKNSRSRKRTRKAPEPKEKRPPKSRTERTVPVQDAFSEAELLLECQASCSTTPASTSTPSSRTPIPAAQQNGIHFQEEPEIIVLDDDDDDEVFPSTSGLGFLIAPEINGHAPRKRRTQAEEAQSPKRTKLENGGGPPSWPEPSALSSFAGPPLSFFPTPESTKEPIFRVVEEQPLEETFRLVRTPSEYTPTSLSTTDSGSPAISSTLLQRSPPPLSPTALLVATEEPQQASPLEPYPFLDARPGSSKETNNLASPEEPRQASPDLIVVDTRPDSIKGPSEEATRPDAISAFPEDTGRDSRRESELASPVEAEQASPVEAWPGTSNERRPESPEESRLDSAKLRSMKSPSTLVTRTDSPVLVVAERPEPRQEARSESPDIIWLDAPEEVKPIYMKMASTKEPKQEALHETSPEFIVDSVTLFSPEGRSMDSPKELRVDSPKDIKLSSPLETKLYHIRPATPMETMPFVPLPLATEKTWLDSPDAFRQAFSLSASPCYTPPSIQLASPEEPRPESTKLAPFEKIGSDSLEEDRPSSSRIESPKEAKPLSITKNFTLERRAESEAVEEVRPDCIRLSLSKDIRPEDFVDSIQESFSLAASPCTTPESIPTTSPKETCLDSPKEGAPDSPKEVRPDSSQETKLHIIKPSTPMETIPFVPLVAAKTWPTSPEAFEGVFSLTASPCSTPPSVDIASPKKISTDSPVDIRRYLEARPESAEEVRPDSAEDAQPSSIKPASPVETRPFVPVPGGLEGTAPFPADSLDEAFSVLSSPCCTPPSIELASPEEPRPDSSKEVRAVSPEEARPESLDSVQEALSLAASPCSTPESIGLDSPRDSWLDSLQRAWPDAIKWASPMETRPPSLPESWIDSPTHSGSDSRRDAVQSSMAPKLDFSIPVFPWKRKDSRKEIRTVSKASKSTPASNRRAQSKKIRTDPSMDIRRYFQREARPSTSKEARSESMKQAPPKKARMDSIVLASPDPVASPDSWELTFLPRPESSASVTIEEASSRDSEEVSLVASPCTTPWPPGFERKNKPRETRYGPTEASSSSEFFSDVLGEPMEPSSPGGSVSSQSMDYFRPGYHKDSFHHIRKRDHFKIRQEAPFPRVLSVKQPLPDRNSKSISSEEGPGYPTSRLGFFWTPSELKGSTRLSLLKIHEKGLDVELVQNSDGSIACKDRSGRALAGQKNPDKWVKSCPPSIFTLPKEKETTLSSRSVTQSPEPEPVMVATPVRSVNPEDKKGFQKFVQVKAKAQKVKTQLASKKAVYTRSSEVGNRFLEVAPSSSVASTSSSPSTSSLASPWASPVASPSISLASSSPRPTSARPLEGKVRQIWKRLPSGDTPRLRWPLPNEPRITQPKDNGPVVRILRSSTPQTPESIRATIQRMEQSRHDRHSDRPLLLPQVPAPNIQPVTLNGHPRRVQSCEAMNGFDDMPVLVPQQPVRPPSKRPTAASRVSSGRLSARGARSVAKKPEEA